MVNVFNKVLGNFNFLILSIINLIFYFFSNSLNNHNFFPVFVSFIIFYIFLCFLYDFYLTVLGHKTIPKYTLPSFHFIFFSILISNFFEINIFLNIFVYLLILFLEHFLILTKSSKKNFFINFILIYSFTLLFLFLFGYFYSGSDFSNYFYANTDFRHYHWQSSDFINFKIQKAHYFFEGVGILISPVNYLGSFNYLYESYDLSHTKELNDFLRSINIFILLPISIFFQVSFLRKYLNINFKNYGFDFCIVFSMFCLFFIYWLTGPDDFAKGYKHLIYICFGIVNGADFYSYFILTLFIFSLNHKIRGGYLVFFSIIFLLLRETNILYFSFYVFILYLKAVNFNSTFNLIDSILQFIKNKYRLLVWPCLFLCFQLSFNVLQGDSIFGNRVLQWNAGRAGKWEGYVKDRFEILDKTPPFRSINYLEVNFYDFINYINYFIFFYVFFFILYMKTPSQKYKFIFFINLIFIFFVLFLNLQHINFPSIWRYNFTLFPFVILSLIIFLYALFRKRLGIKGSRL